MSVLVTLLTGLVWTSQNIAPESLIEYSTALQAESFTQSERHFDQETFECVVNVPAPPDAERQPPGPRCLTSARACADKPVTTNPAINAIFVSMFRPPC
jgi:hypothetical protein